MITGVVDLVLEGFFLVFTSPFVGGKKAWRNFPETPYARELVDELLS